MFQFNVFDIIGAAIALLLGLTIHEFAHAWTADLLGDPTPRDHGRVTLNPIAHLDLIGTIMLVLMVLQLAPIGWGKPVPITPYRMRWGRRGAVLATAAGPLSNILLALFVALGIRLGVLLIPGVTAAAVVSSGGLWILLSSLMTYNAVLAAFNLLPIPPLDGFGILEGLAPPSWDRFLQPLRQYGMWILFFLIMAGAGGVSLLGPILAPLYGGLTRLFYLIALAA